MAKGEEYDVLVIGGGATGCGIALDSISRGAFALHKQWLCPTLHSLLLQLSEVVMNTVSVSKFSSDVALVYFEQNNIFM